MKAVFLKSMRFSLLVCCLFPAATWACNISDIGRSCEIHRSCYEIANFHFQNDLCAINSSGTYAQCSAVALFIKMTPVNYGEDCKIKVLSDSE